MGALQVVTILLWLPLQCRAALAAKGRVVAEPRVGGLHHRYYGAVAVRIGLR